MGLLPDWMIPSTLPGGGAPDPQPQDPYAGQGGDPLQALQAAGFAPPGMVAPNSAISPPGMGAPQSQVLPAQAPAGAPPPVPTTNGAPVDPYDPANSPAPIPVPQIGAAPKAGDVAGAERQQAAALNENADINTQKAVADTDAIGAQQAKLAGAWAQSAKDMGTEQTAYFQAREAAHREAAAENAAWMRQMDEQAAKEPDHRRWWENTSSFGKALWLAGLAFGAIGQSKVYGAKNPAADMMFAEMDHDVEQQKERMARQYETLKLKGQMLDKQHQEKLSDMQDTYSKRIMRLETLRNALLERAKAPGPEAYKQSMLAAAQATEQEKMKVVAKRVENSVTEKEKSLDRSAENYRAGLTDSREKAIANQTDKRDRDLKAADIKKDYDLANLSASTKLAEGKQADTRAISQNTGLSLMELGPDGKPTGRPAGDGAVRVHKDDKSLENAAGLATAANQRYADLQLVKKHIDDDSLWDLATQKDPELVAAVQRLGYSTAKQDDPGGRINDNDFAQGVKQNIGYDPTSGVISAAQSSRNKGAVKKLVEKEMRDIVPRVQNEINKYNDADLNGHNSKIFWSPRSVEAPEVPEPNATQSLEAATGKPVERVEPTTVEDYRKAEKLEASEPTFKGQVLPKHDEAKVASVTASFEGGSPAQIRAIADAALKELGGNSDPWNGPVKQPDTKDRVTALAIKAHEEDALKTSEKAMKDAKEYLESLQKIRTPDKGFDPVSPTEAINIVEKQFGLNHLRPQEVVDLLKAAHVE